MLKRTQEIVEDGRSWLLTQGKSLLIFISTACSTLHSSRDLASFACETVPFCKIPSPLSLGVKYSVRLPVSRTLNQKVLFMSSLQVSLKGASEQMGIRNDSPAEHSGVTVSICPELLLRGAVPASAPAPRPRPPCRRRPGKARGTGNGAGVMRMPNVPRAARCRRGSPDKWKHDSADHGDVGRRAAESLPHAAGGRGVTTVLSEPAR